MKKVGVSELEDRAIEVIQCELQREKDWEKRIKSLRDLGDNTKRSNRVLQREEKEYVTEKNI